ncbi:hypothetical protein J6500_17365 [Bradyrhizobium sp. WSM 1704]|uniref:hypothetical protein n=1 Tax=Bradyrhizobium semiaridum TaxID=2821404 RepID=UPI001CE347A5|nr:hypothetical protein [Bradyrhizobium semiaridum]MCA6123652.1 hypothetical protein [Bradyrhizobium semiaridum]
MIFELIVLGVILLAVGYWATMFAMGRRDDVLHGHFVEDEPDAEPARPVRPLATRAVPRRPLPPARPVPAAQPSDQDSLQALLAVIKRDLKDAAQI